MTIERVYFQKQRFVLTLIYGRLTSQELIEHVAAMNRDYAGIDGIVELADCRYLYDVSELSGSSLLGAANRESGTKRVQGGKGAIVAIDDVVYGLARMYAAIASELREDSQAFRDMDEAIKFLSLGSLEQDVRPLLSEEAYAERMPEAGAFRVPAGKRSLKAIS